MKTGLIVVELCVCLLVAVQCLTFSAAHVHSTNHNQLSSRPSSVSSLSPSLSSSVSSSYDKFFYRTTNGVIPLDREITIFIFSGESKRLYYQIHNTKSDIALTVTPCEDNVEWKLLFIEEKTHKKGEQKTGRTRRRYKRRHNKYIYSNSLNNANPILLTSYIGNERRTYSDVSTPPGLYIVDFNSNGKHASVKIFLSQHYPYPLLPNVASIKLLSVKSDRALIGWNMSPSETVSPIEYCVLVSDRDHSINNCQLDIGGDGEQFELDLLPAEASTSFAHWWGNTVKKMLRESRSGHGDENYTVECVGKKTWHVFRRLDARLRYFVHVFARNLATNATSAYRPFNITLAADEPIKLKDGDQVAVRLNSANNYTKLLKYSLASKRGETLWLFVNSCSGLGPIRVTVRSATVRKSLNESQHLVPITAENVFDIKTIEISADLNASSLVVELRSETTTERSAVVLMSRKQSKFPFPRLPDDRKIKILETLTDCESVTLAWTASPDDKVLYCIYQSESGNHHAHHFPTKANVCAETADSNSTVASRAGERWPVGHQPRSKKILCRRYHKLSKRRFNNVIMQNVRRLTSGAKYVFQVTLTKYRGRTLSYEPVWVSTRSKSMCH